MKRIVLFLLFSFSICIKSQVNSFSFNINGTVPAGMAEALTIAGENWSKYLTITIPIKVNVFTVNSTFLPFSAITLANGRKNFSNAPQQNILYTTSLANQLAGAELNVGEFDMDIYFNLATNYYFGTGVPSASETDFISTSMHEIGHGLGFYSDGYVDGSNIGSFGNIPTSAIFPLTPSFPWRGLDSVPSIYDTYIVKNSGNSLINAAPQNSSALADSINMGALYFSGPLFANASHSNTPIRLSGGTGNFSLGVDLLHIHNSYANTIMSYYWGAGDTVRIPAEWELGILKEIGWQRDFVGLTEYKKTNSANVFPNPANESLTISSCNFKSVQLYTVLGELIQFESILNSETEINLDVRALNHGVYFLKIDFKENAASLTKKIIVAH